MTQKWVTQRRATPGATSPVPPAVLALAVLAPAVLIEQAEHALLLSAAVTLPVLAVAAVVGLLVAAFQAASQIQDPTLSHLPRLIAVIAALAALGPWMGGQIGSFAERMMVMAARL